MTKTLKYNPEVLLRSRFVEGDVAVFFKGVKIPEKIMLHCCCAPCSEWPVMFMRSHGIEPLGYYYNPNIHPQAEWERRLDGLHRFSALHHFEFLTSRTYEEEKWRNFTTKAKSGHCRVCYALRLYEVARMTAEKGLPGFTTALLVSPYQNWDLLVQTGKLAAAQFGVAFYPFDFRPGYRYGQELAKRDEIYRQRYCGCIYSLGESQYKEKIAKELNYPLAAIPVREETR